MKAVKTLGVERPKLLAITALTSFDDESWTAIGGQLPISDQVIRLAKLAKDCGMDGVVCSALEAKMIREACGDDFLISNTWYSSFLCNNRRPKTYCYTC